MAATSLKLPDDLKQRIVKIVAGSNRTSHAFMVEAIERATKSETRASELERLGPEGVFMLDVAAIQALLDPLFPGLMGVHLLEVTPERVLAEMDVRPDLCTAGGVMHGGAYMAFADTLGAVGTLVNLPAGKGTATADSSTKFIAGARVNSKVLGESVALHRGQTTMVWQTSITNAQGKLCAVVTQTQLVLEGK